MKNLYPLFALLVLISCQNKSTLTFQHDELIIGGDFSIMKKMEDLGGEYKVNNVRYADGLDLFRDNGFNYARFRLFHSPNMEGPVCNNLEYTMELLQRAKSLDFKILLDFHYSDTWADPGKQFKPAAWKSLSLETLTDSVYNYTFKVLSTLKRKNLLPDMVQIGNEISHGMLWPEGKLWKNGEQDWESLASILKAGINAVNEVDNNIEIMIHTDAGGDKANCEMFFKALLDRAVYFDLIGLSYYPWWHGTFDDLIDNLSNLKNRFEQDVIIVETAYYANGWYPTEGDWVKDNQPFPATEQGQYDFMKHLLKIVDALPNVTGLFYWKPDGIKVENSDVHYLGRSLFDKSGNAYKGISAWSN